MIRRLETLCPRGPDWAGKPSTGECALYSIQTDSPRPGWYQISCNGVPIWKTKHVGQVFAYLIWTITNIALEWLKSEYLLFHGGAVAYESRGIILPAASRSGKTTLTAGLVGHGFQYFSDDVAVIDRNTLRLLPFPKNMCIKRGSREVLTSLYPRMIEGCTASVRFDRELVWYLPPPPGAWPTESTPIRYIVLPQYTAGATTALVPLDRTQAIRRFFEQSFSLGSHGAAGTAALASVLQGAECYALTVGDLPAAVDLVRDLVGA